MICLLIFLINFYCELYIFYVIEIKFIFYYLFKYVFWVEEMIYKVKFFFLKSIKESLILFFLSFIWSCLLFIVEKVVI